MTQSDSYIPPVCYAHYDVNIFIASELDVSKIINHFNMNQHEKMKNPVYDLKRLIL